MSMSARYIAIYRGGHSAATCSARYKRRFFFQQRQRRYIRDFVAAAAAPLLFLASARDFMRYSAAASFFLNIEIYA